MEYRVHNSKKWLRKNRVQICIVIVVILLIFGLVSLFTSKGHDQNFLSNDFQPPETRKTNNFTLIRTYVRNGKQYYTQGLIFKDSQTLIESAGLHGDSSIHYINLEDMKVGLESKLEYEYFGEGCELISKNDRQEIYQLTWQEKKIFVWDAKDLKQKRILRLPNEISEGWGISARIEADEDGKQNSLFYVSNGSNNLFIVEPDTFEILKTIQVKYSNGTLVKNLNELEFIRGKLWANVYMSDNIVVINPDTGYVEVLIDLSELGKIAKNKAQELGLEIKYGDVLNGIAYDPKLDRLIVTGKKWPMMWEIKVHDT